MQFKRLTKLAALALFAVSFAMTGSALTLNGVESATEPTVAESAEASLQEIRSTVSLDRTIVFVGEDFNISYTGAKYAKDWIRFVYCRDLTDADLPTNSGTKYANYCYVTGTGDNTMSFLQSKKWGGNFLNGSGLPGTDEYFAEMKENDGYTTVSNLFYFRVIDRSKFDAGNMKLTADRTEYFPGETVHLTFENLNSASWTGLYTAKHKIGKAGQESIKWTNTKGSGTASIQIPNDLTPGAYQLIVFEDGGYNAMYGIEIEVLAPAEGEPVAPKNVSFVPAANAGEGFADGMMIAGLGEKRTDGVAFYWGDDNAPFEDYTYVGYGAYNPASGRYEYQVTPGNLIPAGTTTLYARGVNGTTFDLQNGKATLSVDIASVKLDVKPLDLGEPLYRFEVISDLHTKPNAAHSNNIHVKAALADIAQNRAGSIGVMMVGDVVDLGAPEEYAEIQSYIDSILGKNIPVYATVGNHEFYYNQIEGASTGPFFEENWQRFREAFGWNDGEYYRYTVLNGDYFIFMGEEARGESENGVSAPGWNQGTADGYYSETQREWLRGLLAEASVKGANAFVFMHQSIDNTVSGSFDGQNWGGINDDEQMREIIESYPNTVLFTGHSHWNLNSYDPFINGGADGASYFNTASAGYLWNDANTNAEGSEGLFVDVYADCVVVRGRDFVGGRWVSNVQALIRADKTPSVGAPKNYPDQELRLTGMPGMRFSSFVTAAQRGAADEYGFLIAVSDALGDNADRLMFADDVKGNTALAEKVQKVGTLADGVKYIYVTAYSKDTGADVHKPDVIDGEDVLRFNAVLVNMPATAYQTKFVVRPYLRVGEHYFYGETMVKSLYELALEYDGADNDFVKEILGGAQS